MCSCKHIKKISMMSVYLIFSLLMALVSAALPLDENPHPPPPMSRDVLVTLHEMQRANYFTFVVLLKMVQSKLPSNSTFLMPSDQMLSTVSIPESQVMEFLDRHSVPAPLLFEELIRLPAGTLIPSYRSDCMIKVDNFYQGMRRLYLNDVQLVRPNVCMAGFSFRCHGIDGVLQAGHCNSSSPFPAPLPRPPSVAPPSPGKASHAYVKSTSSILNCIVVLLLMITLSI